MHYDVQTEPSSDSSADPIPVFREHSWGMHWQFWIFYVLLGAGVLFVGMKYLTYLAQ